MSRHVLDVAQFAQFMRVTEKTVLVWAQAGMPLKIRGAQGRGKKTAIDIRDAVGWWISENYDRLELDRQRTRLAAEQADRQALENRARRGDLVPLGEIEREFAGLLTEIRINALAIPSKLAPELEGLDVAQRKAAIERSVFELLDRAASWEPDQAGAPASTEGAAPAAAADDKPVGRRKPDAKPRGRRRARKVANKPG